MMEGDIEKSESPTPSKLKKARNEGQVPRSKELVSWLMLFSSWNLLWLLGEYFILNMKKILRKSLLFDSYIKDESYWIVARFSNLIKKAFMTSTPFFLYMTLIATLSSLLVGGILFTNKVISLDFKRLNPSSGIRRLFSMQTITELIKTSSKVFLVGAGIITALWFFWPRLITLSQGIPNNVIVESAILIRQCVLIIILFLIPVVIFDVLYQLFVYHKKLRMSRHEIREEYKEQEGDPQLKNLIRKRQQAQRRMIKDVENADVVIINPTIYSVALRYEQSKMIAPKILAKGIGALALNIRCRAKHRGIPILESPSLARTLYKYCEVGSTVPVALYSAVAEVLAWVYSLRRWKKEGGVQPRKPNNIAIPKSLDFSKGNIFNDKSNK